MDALPLFASASGIDWVAIASVISAALGIAVYVGRQDTEARRRKRSKWRAQDRLSGYTDEGGRHPGGLDLIFGWTDANGRNPGLVERVEDIEDWQDAHDRRHVDAGEP